MPPGAVRADRRREAILPLAAVAVAATSREWDGNTWTQVASTGPSARGGHAMAYDSQRGPTVLFGGVDTFNILGDTWELSYVSVTSTFGSGCGSPVLDLASVSGAGPITGTTAQVSLTNVPTPPSIAFVALGWSKTITGTFPLPLPLDSFGMPGCVLLQSSDAAAEPTTITGPGTATFSLPLPNWGSLIGVPLYLQGWAPAPGANPAGVIVSNGIEWFIGNI